MKQFYNKSYIFLILAALVIATVIAFEPMRHNQFVDYDDEDYVTENPQVTRGLTPESFVWAFTTGHASNWHPLTWLSHMLDCQLFGLQPFWHHLINLLFHIANTLLLFWLLKKTTGALWRSAFVAAAFALHPLHVESVAWISERKDVLSSLFWMLTIAFYVRYTEQPNKIRYLLVILIFALGLMAKPMLVTLPFVLLLLDYWPLNRLQWPDKNNQSSPSESESVTPTGCRYSISFLIKEKIPLFVLVILSSIITFIVQQKGGAVAPAAFSLRILNALVSYMMYIGKIIWPTRLAILYQHPTYHILLWPTAVAIFLLPMITIRISRLSRTYRYLPVGWLWYLGTLVPVIGIIQVGNQAMADRYMYLPSIGIFIILTWGAVDFLAKWHYRKIILGISAVLLLVAMLLCTRAQVRHWRNSLTLFGHTVEVTKGNYIMRTKYGISMLKAGRADEAISQFNEVLKIKPQYSEAKSGLGDSFLTQGKLDEAITSLNEALSTDKKQPEVYHNLGTAYARKGKLDLAIQNYNEALRQKPNFLGAHLNLAKALMVQGNLDLAVKHCREALRINPHDNQAQQLLNKILAAQNKLFR